jgi:glycosyltransferase involved in cell wall biosynthesis
MIIHHLSSSPAGGAGGAAKRLIALLGKGLDSHRLFCPAPVDGNPDVQGIFSEFPRLGRPRDHLQRLMFSLAKKGRPRSPEPLSLAHIGTLPPPKHPFWQCDVVHFHWLGDTWLDFSRLAKNWPQTTPAVWTMHDLNPVSSICHYPSEACQSLDKGCTNCPWAGGPAGNLILRNSFAAKQSFFATVRPYLVSICQWQHALVRKSPLGQQAGDLRLIRNAFTFDASLPPSSRAEARRCLGLDPAARYLLLGAANLANPRKGADLAVAAAPAGWRWLTFGTGAKHLHLPAQTTHLGHILDPSLLAQIYAAADLFVLPSREECLAQTGLEALVNGTPVVTFADTGPADYVRDGVTGVLANEKTAQSLRHAIDRFASLPALAEQSAVRFAFAQLHGQEYAPAVVTRQYNDLYSAARAKSLSGG